MESIELYTRQAVVLRAIIHAWATRKAVNIVAGQRAGKTRIAHALLEHMHGDTLFDIKRFVIVGPTKEHVQNNFASDLQNVEYYSGKQLINLIKQLRHEGEHYLQLFNKTVIIFEEAEWYPEARECFSLLMHAGKYKMLALSSRGDYPFDFSLHAVRNFRAASWDWNEQFYEHALAEAKSTSNIEAFIRDFGLEDSHDRLQYEEIKRAFAAPREHNPYIEPEAGEHQEIVDTLKEC